MVPEEGYCLSKAGEKKKVPKSKGVRGFGASLQIELDRKKFYSSLSNTKESKSGEDEDLRN